MPQPKKAQLSCLVLTLLVPAAAALADPEILPRTLAQPILVEDLSTEHPSGLVPVTGALGTLELRRATIVDTIAPSNPEINDIWIDASAGGKYRTCIFTGANWIETDGSGVVCGTLQQRTLVVSLAGSGSGAVFTLPGGISCGEECARPFTFGEAVQLYAIPAADSIFLGWSGCSSSKASPIAVLMEQDQACVANFATSIGVAAADWSPSYDLYFDFEEVFAASSTSAAKRVPNLGLAGPACDLRQYGSNLPMNLSAIAQQGGHSINFASLGSGVNQRLGVRMQSDATNGSCDAARLGAAGPDYGSFSYHSRFRPQNNTESGATMSRISEVANGGPGGWAFEWQENGSIVARVWDGSNPTALVSANGLCPAGGWCVVSLTFDDPLDTFCLYVNGHAAACAPQGTVTDPATGTLAYFRFGNSANTSKLDGLIDESGLRLGVAYTAEEACRICSCGIDGSLCACDPLQPQLFAAGGGIGLNVSQCGSCALPACDQGAP